MQIKKLLGIRWLLVGVFMSAIAGISLAAGYFNPYLPPPPPDFIQYATPASQTPTVIPPPPGGWANGGAFPPQFRIPSMPIAPLDPKLEDFPIDLDLADFASRNPYPKSRCFFPVKGRKDIVEYIPDQQEGMFIFPTGACQMDDETCTIGQRKGRLPGMKKTEPPLYSSTGESSYGGLAVIPYKYADDIIFGKCMPTWTGYMETDMYIRAFETPKRDYSKQSCYHPVSAIYANEKPKTIFCDSEKCQFDEAQYCEHRTGQCYKNGYPLKTKKGESVLNYEKLGSINWDFCADETGALIPEDGGLPYEDRFAPGCSYRITAPNYHEKQYAGYINFLIHCDENRCSHQELNFDMKRKEYLIGTEWANQTYTKTPPLKEFPTIDWQCLDATKVRDYNKRLFCYNIGGDEQNPDCRLCYENKKFSYKGCRYPYDEMGRRADIPEAWRAFNLTKELETMSATISSLKQEYDILWETDMWFSGLYGGSTTEMIISGMDERERQRMASIVAKFNEIQNPGAKDAEKLQRQLSPFITEDTRRIIKKYTD